MIDVGFVRMLAILSNKKWGDDDIIDDLKTLSEALAKNMVVLRYLFPFHVINEIYSPLLLLLPLSFWLDFWVLGLGLGFLFSQVVQFVRYVQERDTVRAIELESSAQIREVLARKCNSFRRK
jgi:hypothetical protein